MSGLLERLTPLLVALLVSFAGFAGAEELTAVGETNLFTATPMLLGAHRGGKDEWPENTLMALREAAVRWPEVLLEVDVHSTADGHAVLMHDFGVERTTDGSGFVPMMTLEELRSLDAAHHFTPDRRQSFPHRGTGVTIPTLEEALNACPGHRFLIEMKDGLHVARATAEAILGAGAAARCIVASVNPAFLEEFRALAPEVATCYDVFSAATMLGALRGGGWEEYTPQHRMLALSPSLKQRFDLTPREIETIREKGILVCFFTVNDAEEMRRLIGLGADSILTDRPSLLAKVMEEEMQVAACSQ